MKYLLSAFVIILCINCNNSKAQGDIDWLTYYEKSDYLETPRYDESIRYSKQLANESEYIEYGTFGISPQGRELPYLIADRNKNFTPESVKKSGNAVLFVEACIHPGESEGKDAGFMLLRDILISKKYPELLKNTTLIFIPIFNIDGHERFSPYNRINQNGPKEMGWRTTAQNLNLNRDFSKADAPEMQQWLAFFNEWLPDFFMDIHTTDGADYQYALTYGMHTLGDMEPVHTKWQNNYLKNVEEKLLNDDVLMFPYVSFRRWHDPRSGLVRHTASPRYSTGYLAAQNRPALLVETHMLKNYKTRVEATYHLLRHTIEIIDNEHNELININKKIDAKTQNLVGKEIILDYETSEKDSTTVKFKGVDYKIIPSDLTGGDWVQFSDIPKEYELVLFEKIIPTAKAILPKAYIIPVEWAEIIEKLKLHGIECEILKENKQFEISTYKFTGVRFANSPFEGRQMVNQFNLEEIKLTKEFPAGSAIIPVNQRTAKLIALLLEPNSPDSFLRWGFFNTIFERKEYVETYVMEKMAREMIAKDPQLKVEFENAVKQYPQYLNNQWAKVFWFFERTPYWDQQKDVYPIGKIIN